MRPHTNSSDAVTSRPCKSSVADMPHHSNPSQNVPTTFFLRREEDLDQTGSSSETPQRDSVYGVQSLEEALDSAFDDKAGGDVGSDKGGLTGKKKHKAEGTSPRAQVAAGKLGPVLSESSSPGRRSNSPSHRQLPHVSSRTTLSQPLTPLTFESPRPDTMGTGTPRSMSIHSFRLSDDESNVDEATSQVITSSGDEDEEEGEPIELEDSAPQLVMPSIQMPSRRPFTTRGKNMGRLKVLVAGASGAGKTSMIKAIVRVCEDIVHVDPLSSDSPTLQASSPSISKDSRKRSNPTATSRITEVHASTKPYPSWWADLEESRVLRRRKSSGDTVLERNLCFIDTPGYHGASSSGDDMESVIRYMEFLLQRNAALSSMTDSELMAVLSGNGGLQVDAVLYLFSHGTDLSRDVEYVKRLSEFTNVIPLISKADTISPVQLADMKASILARLRSSFVKPFMFGRSLDEALIAAQQLVAQPASKEPTTEDTQIRDLIFPFAISSNPSSDSETMDSSLLMSPDYVQPLLPSELSALVSRIFEPDNIAWLRHSAAKKFLQWRARAKLAGNSETLRTHQFNRHDILGLGLNTHFTRQDPFSVGPTRAGSTASSIISCASPSQVLVPHAHSHFFSSASPSIGAPEHAPYSDYTVARLRDHTQREERLAQVHLARWAADLQRSLRNERERFEELQQGERAKWLLERVGDEVREGAIVPAPDGYSTSRSSRADWAIVRHGAKVTPRSGEKQWLGQAPAARRVDPRDPLGLCDLGDGMRRGGVVVLQVLGGFGVLGAVVVAAVRIWGGENAIAGLMPEGGLWAWMSGGAE